MIHFKNDIDRVRYFHLCPEARYVMHVLEDCFTNARKKLFITSTVSTIEEDKELNRVTASHRQARAFDVRSWNLRGDERSYFSDKFWEELQSRLEVLIPEEYFYVGATSGKSKLFHIHGEQGRDHHAHFAVHPRYGLNPKPKSKLN